MSNRRSRAGVRGGLGDRLAGFHGPFGWGAGRTAAAAVGALVLLALLGFIVIAATLPDPSNIAIHAGEVKIFDRNQKLVADVLPGSVSRQDVGLDQISPSLQQATVAAEDRHFFEHHGIDWGRVVKAMSVDLIHRSAISGASTITEQLANNALSLGKGLSIGRKVKEAILATEIEQRFSKQEILDLYLNTIYYGYNAYGVEAAARVYFDKDARDLSLGQASMLAGLPQRPSFYDPGTNYDAAKVRQSYVLDQMVRSGYINQPQADAAKAEDLRPQFKFKAAAATGPAPHFVKYVLDKLDRDYGATVRSQGSLTVISTLDLGVQRAASDAVQNGVAHFKSYNVNNGAALVEDMHSGHQGEILAMVGSADFNNASIAGQINIVTRQRQPGSSFKPYVYYTGIADHKFDTLTVFDDSPLQQRSQTNPAFGNVQKDVHDFDDKTLGKLTMRYALVDSRNIPAEEAMSVAGPENVVDEVHRLGIGTEVKPVLSSAIGASDVTMLDHVEAYGVFATQGTRHDPVAIVKVLDSDGNDITAHPNGGEKIADAASLYIVNNILKGYPSWWGPQLGHPNLGFDRPMGVKSGTSNVGTSTGDGWLMAYNPDLVIATWAGHTSNDPRAGNQTRQFFGVYEGYWMTVPILRALTGSEWRDDFRQPSGVTQVNCQLPPDVKTIQTPSGGELVLAGDNPPCAAPSPSPSVSASPTELPSPSPTIPSPLSEISPTPRRGASPTPSASPSP